MIDRERLRSAIHESWSAATSAVPSVWSDGNPSRGQCDVTSLVVLEYLGGDLQLAKVFLGDKQVEHHYWNQVSDQDALDLTGEQFIAGERVGEPDLIPHDVIRSKYSTVRSEVRHRHELLRTAVSSHLGVAPPHPLGS